MDTGQLTKSDKKQNSTQDRKQHLLKYEQEERHSRKGKHGYLKRGRTKMLPQR